ncbi:MAG TPA: hypothetical protein PK322_07820 [Opitutaceae bacterium]|nr:hypothetical protein [Opitutaceae bacterium]
MERRDFLKSACAAGLCSCAVATLIAGDGTPAETPPAAPPSPEDWRIGFAKQRYGKLVSTVAAKVDPATFAAIIEEVGQFCGGTGFAGQFVGNLDGFIEELRKRWKAQVEHDQERGAVRLSFDSAGGDCHCPLMSKATVPPAACRCSVGSIRQMFTIVAQRPVGCELTESVLQGGARCAFEVRLAVPA